MVWSDAHLTDDQVMGSIPAGSCNTLSYRLIVNIFCGHFVSLFQEEQLSASGERLYKNTGELLRG